MKGVCRLCGCTNDHACQTKDGPCSWVMEDLCSACVVEIPGTNLLVPKECRFCLNLEYGQPYRGKPNYTCSRGRFGDCQGVQHYYYWSGIWRPNKVVAAAQRRCNLWKLNPQAEGITAKGRPQ